MHELVLEFVEAAAAPYALARYPLDQGGLVALFGTPARRPGRRAAAPRWLAKTANGEAGCRRLRAEARALEHLAPYAEALGIPRLLGFQDAVAGSGEKARACLIQSGVPGRPGRTRAGWSERRVPGEILAAGSWLGRFQQMVPAPHAGSITGLADRACVQAGIDQRLHPEEARLVAMPLAVTRDLLGRQEAAAGARPAVAVHGDFWAGNLLEASAARMGGGGTLHVIDWSGFDSGTGLEDILNFFLHLEDGDEAWTGGLSRLMAPGPWREYLRSWAAAAQYSEGVARLAFYLYLLRRVGWELGWAMQARSAEERSLAQRRWGAALAWLAQHRYPDPFTPMPV